MGRRRHRAIIGVAMVLLGLVQAGSSVVGSDWQFAVFGLLYALIGIGYLWAEVYTVDR
ncbi:hypothetical protein [Natrinema longum]|uniref:Uncharacterized protein n=1 Tax=Natrinema longum TaxID=370324 RepID=A0A8A2U954_9EURY|nr:hypothetical protein [Natrinema longum]MBZ6493466.1 hypothetical protein [Natrinema longum]QSW85187.1 hypothetical protein J0X27_17360 [Natrinema longum]